MSDETVASDGLSPEERKVVEQFRQQMTAEEGPAVKQVENESLGNLLDGTKIQFKPGPGKDYSPALRGFARYEGREQRRLEALAAAKARAEKNKKTVVARVNEAALRLKGSNVGDTIAYIKELSQQEQEIYTLAEEVLHDGGRKQVIGSLAAVGAKLRETFESERATLKDIAES